MGDTGSQHLTAQQMKWFKAIGEGLERDTGRTLEAWVAIAKTCPETAHRAKLKWFKETWGLLQNRASYVLDHADPVAASPHDPDRVRETLWKGQAGLRILERVETKVLSLEGVIRGQRKSFTAWSRRVQFAALRPWGRDGAMLGLAVPMDPGAGLLPRGRESWSDRLKSKVELGSPDDVTSEIGRLLEAAWKAS